MMNPLQEYPQLFANGEFKVQFHDLDYQMWKMDEIETLDYGILICLRDSKDKHLSVNQCTLIARPIEDMTDEEWKEANKKGLAGWNGREYNLVNVYETLLYLLSIGVYPFDQSHFDDGTVIDSREV